MSHFAENFLDLAAGRLSEPQAESFLRSCRPEDIAPDNLRIACQILQEMAVPIAVPEGTIDVCGTGGDAKGTLNISTAVALVVAAAGVPVAKHGNRAATSQSGAIDVLEALGINVDLPPAAASQQLASRNITFLAAQAYHPVLVGLAPLRRKIGQRTIFNLLGPLLNPGHIKRQLVGVYSRELTLPLAQTLQALGSDRAWVVNGDGLDEITITGPTHVTSLKESILENFTLDPRDYNIPLAGLSAIKGGTPAENAAAMICLLEGEQGAYRDIVSLNVAASLLIAGKVADFASGIALSRQTIDNGKALALLRSLQQDRSHDG
jgi:anthranilate phosphoribosyltransferase